MELFLLVLLLLAAIGLSNLVNHFAPFVPVPLIQIALGVLLAALPLGIQVPMNHELFFVLFIAPLLFHDGRRVSRTALWQLRFPILLLALGLVFATVVAVGSLIHLLIPSIPLPAAFALAAILSPTDVVAVGAMSGRVKMPGSILHLLEGEGLMNDASGLVAFHFALAAALTGVFSLPAAVWSFLKISVGGAAGGALLAVLVIRLRVWIRRLGMEDVTVHILIQILTPFAIYLAAEHLHVSGILAVVAAGIVHGIERDRETSPQMRLQIASGSTWSVILYILNGLVFVLLGSQIPEVTRESFIDPTTDNAEVLGFIVVITAALLLLRSLWVYAAWRIGWRLKLRHLPKPSLRQTGIITISGVRGAVTLAGAFSIPEILENGSAFPHRTLILFIAAGVILVTLAAASLFLPVLAGSKAVFADDTKERTEKKALIRTHLAAIREIRERTGNDNREAAAGLIASYTRALQQLQYPDSAAAAGPGGPEETSLRLKALEAEARYLDRLIQEKRIDAETAEAALERIHRMKQAARRRSPFRGPAIGLMLKGWLRYVKAIFTARRGGPDPYREKRRQRQKLQVNMAVAAIQALRGEINPDNQAAVYRVIGEYNDRIAQIRSQRRRKASREWIRRERELQERAFQAERNEVQRLYELGQIPMETARKLRQQINMREVYWAKEFRPV
ncbi:Na+/H+ antiporter [Cohnella caldifontis]|uniref:Na+/H+ antiporter n=1 Tax=Cohnella caldifontis TaxID=3027471 RepID=UPI0023EBB93C|nr:Na+/H+ antiporter [Cohnella sp. YIM B05605]